MNLTEFNKEMSSDGNAADRLHQGVVTAWHARHYAKLPTGKRVISAGSFFKVSVLNHPDHPSISDASPVSFGNSTLSAVWLCIGEQKRNGVGIEGRRGLVD